MIRPDLLLRRGVVPDLDLLAEFPHAQSYVGDELMEE
jgi:hypothetical protein